jgi:hypothetical protein
MKIIFSFFIILLCSCVPKTKLDVSEINPPTLEGKRFKIFQCTSMRSFNDLNFTEDLEIYLKFTLIGNTTSMSVSQGADCSEESVFTINVTEVTTYRSKTLSNSIYFKLVYSNGPQIDTTIFLYQEDGLNLRFYDQIQTLNTLPFEPNKYLYDDDPEAQEFDQDKTKYSVLFIPF